MDEQIKEALNPDSRFHDNLLQHVKRLTDLSRAHMSKHYDLWDRNDAIIRGERIADEQDRKADKRGEPVKMILPFTYAQVQTFIAFFTLLFNQRSYFYEIETDEVEVEPAPTPERDAQALLDRELSRNMFSQVQYQSFLNLARCGFCVIKTSWEEETMQVKESTAVPETTDFTGATIPAQTNVSTTTKYKKQGNKLVAVNPYKFFPDVRFPLSRFQEGEFCASEDEYSVTRLKKMQADGMITNADKIQSFKAETDVSRRMYSYTASQTSGIKTLSVPGGVGAGWCVVTEIQVWIDPQKFKEDNGTNPFGSDLEPDMYVIWYANDQTILRCEKMNYPHGKFCYDLGEYSSDQFRVVNESLAEVIGALQDVATWFLNSRITSVRKIIDNKLVVDPLGIEMQDLKDRSPVIRLKEGMASRGGVDSFIKQLEVQDVTSSHVTDVQTLWSFMQISTGINDNALGQYNGGRRSAAEARTVNAGAASRLKTIATVLWETLFVPLGEKMLSNLVDNLALESFQRAVGKDADQTRLDAFKQEGVPGFVFEFFDGTAPSEKGYIAQSMQDLLLGLLSNPQTAMMLGQEPFRSLIVEIADLRGIRSPERFLPPVQPIIPTNVTPITGATGGGTPQAGGVPQQPVVPALPAVAAR